MNTQHFSFNILQKDAMAGSITGLMAIPLSIGICMMSEYPIQTGLATVVFACIVGFISSLFRTGNYVGVPGIAAGLAPVLALGVHTFGHENMPFLIFLTSFMQMVVWKFRLERYILQVVPNYLVEGLLAGVGLKIAMKFVPFTYATVVNNPELFWTYERLQMIAFSILSFGLFIYLYKRFKQSNPGIPYIVVIVGGIILSFFVSVPMLHFEPTSFEFILPIPKFDQITWQMTIEMFFFAAMLALIDVIEQVMSNAAIEKLDPLKRKSDSNNSLLAIWIANMGSSFFGGMTNLDGLAKSSTNAMAGAVTKMSALFTAAVISIVLVFPQLLHYLPEFSLAVLMIFTGWKMIAGMYHVAQYGKYAFGLSLFCAILVFKLGIFEGLLLALVVHSFIVYIIYKHEQHLRTLEIIRQFFKTLSAERTHAHAERKAPKSASLIGSQTPAALPDYHELRHFLLSWSEQLNMHDKETLLNIYDHSGLLHDITGNNLLIGREHIETYFESLFQHKSVKVQFETFEAKPYKEGYVLSGKYAFSYQDETETVLCPAHYSFTCQKKDTSWHILEHHSTVLPK